MTDPTSNERQRRWYRNHREAKTAITRGRYYDAKASGRCVCCYSRPAVTGIVRCGECREKAKARKTKLSRR